MCISTCLHETDKCLLKDNYVYIHSLIVWSQHQYTVWHENFAKNLFLRFKWIKNAKNLILQNNEIHA